MKNRVLPIYALPCVLLLAVQAAQAQGPVTLPANAASPPGAGSSPGFIVRTAQAPDGTVVSNTFLRAVRQLNGTLRDPDGALVENVAVAGPETGGVTHVPVIDFIGEAETFTGQFFDSDTLFPGLEPFGINTLFATEVVAYISLPAGESHMGVTAALARTDEVNDDGWELFCGANPRSYFATPVARYGRLGSGFPNEAEQLAGNVNVFSFTAPQAGVYPFRLVYWQQTGRAMLEWFMVKNPGTDTEERMIINTGFAENTAFRTLANAPAATGPYTAEVSPQPGASGVPAAQAIEAVLKDGATPVNAATVAMKLNGTAVTPVSAVREGAQVLVKYTPDPARTTVQNTVTLEYQDSTGAAFTEQWSFTIPPAGAVAAVPVAGQWDFDRGDLSATKGQALQYLSTLTRETTEFGLTQDFGISDIDGQPALVMKVPGDLSRDIGYVMTHGISPNGGGQRVNQYTLIMDVYVETTGTGAAALWQTSSVTNQDDGDLFWQGNNFGQGENGYNGTGQFTAGAWHRVAAAYDMAATPPVVVKYVDGIKQDDWTANQGVDNDRRTLLPTAVLFADGDGPSAEQTADERRAMYVNSVQIRAGRLTDAQMVMLGGPEAAGIPEVISSPAVAGQWDFNQGTLRATIGKPLQYLDGDGEEGETKAGTQYGSPETFGIADLPGATPESPGSVMYVPGDLSRNIGYIMTHGIAPNGGGQRVNQYTLIMDVYVETSGTGAASLLQINSLANDDDGDLFWQGNNFGQGTDGYNGTGQFTAGTWHRVAAAYDMAATPPVVVKYVDGIKQDEWTANQSVDNERRALPPAVVLFADGGNADERRAMYVSSIQIRPGRLTDEEMEVLGEPSAAGIPLIISPVPSTEPPRISFGASGANFLYVWPRSSTGWALEGSTNLTTWQAVTGINANAAIINSAAAGAPRFLRLKRAN